MPKQSRRKLTKTMIDNLPPGAAIWDSEVIGFGVRRQVNHCVFVLKTTVNKRQVFRTIGKHGSPWTLHEARREAARLLLGDYDKSSGRVSKTEGSDCTIEELCQRYLLDHAPTKKARSQQSDRSLIRNHVIPLLGQISVQQASRADIVRFRNAVKDGKTAPKNPAEVRKSQKGGHPVRGGIGVANRAVAFVSKLFNLAEDWDLRRHNSNPARRVPKFREFRRERYLSPAELARLGAVLRTRISNDQDYAAFAILLLMLTGARLNEILTLRWEWIDLDRGMIFLPDSKTAPNQSGLTKRPAAS